MAFNGYSYGYGGGGGGGGVGFNEDAMDVEATGPKVTVREVCKSLELSLPILKQHVS